MQGSLCLDLELAHQIVVGLGVFAFEILHQAAAFANFFDETAARGEVLLVALQVFRKVFDFFRENSDLDLRGAGIGRMSFEFLNNAFLLVLRQHSLVGVFRPQCILANGIRAGRAGFAYPSALCR